MNKRRVVIACMLLVFVALLVAGTVYAWSLPHVTVAFSQEGTFTFTAESSGIISLLPDGETYACEALFAFDSGVIYMQQGDFVLLQLPDFPYSQTYGEILEVLLTDGAAFIRVGFNPQSQGSDVELSGGESVNVFVEKTTDELRCIIPQSAVFEDEQGQYILLLEGRRGAWGSDYRLRRVEVDILMRQGTEICCDRDEGFALPVVIACDQPVSDGSRVRIFP